MELKEALLNTLDKYKISGKKLSEASGIPESQISYFRSGKRSVELKSFQRIVDVLPSDAYEYFLRQLALESDFKQYFYPEQTYGTKPADLQLLVEEFNVQELSQLLHIVAERLNSSKPVVALTAMAKI